MRLLGTVALLVTTLVLLAGCGGSKKSSKPAAPAKPTPGQIAAANAVFERSYSECSTYTLQRLSTKYHSVPTFASISVAVGQAWAKEFGADKYAAESGRRGCLQAFRSKK